MHAFSTNSSERKHVPFFVAVLAIGASMVVSSIVSSFHLELPWWAPPLDTMAFYGCFYGLFDRFIWKWKPIRVLRISRLPVIAGRWRGRIEPANAGDASIALAKTINVEVMIHQTWLGLLICAETSESKSRSVSANLLIGDEATLSYEYLNEPRMSATSTMHTHKDTARLVLKKDGTVLEGEYYSGRDRQSFGAIYLRKVS